MTTNFKTIMCAMAISGLAFADAVYASNNNNDPTVEPVVAPVQPTASAASLTSQDLSTIQILMTLMNNVYAQVQNAQANGGKADVANIINAVFEPNGSGAAALTLLDALVEKINGAVQSSNNPKMATCQRCFGGFTSSVDASANKLKKLLPLVQKYYNFFDQETKDGKQAHEIMGDLILLPDFLVDINSIINTVALHRDNLAIADQKAKLKALKNRSYKRSGK